MKGHLPFSVHCSASFFTSSHWSKVKFSIFPKGADNKFHKVYINPIAECAPLLLCNISLVVPKKNHQLSKKIFPVCGSTTPIMAFM